LTLWDFSTKEQPASIRVAVTTWRLCKSKLYTYIRKKRNSSGTRCGVRKIEACSSVYISYGSARLQSEYMLLFENLRLI
jgi:hypothetical protein